MRVEPILSYAALARSRDFGTRRDHVEPAIQDKVIPDKRKKDTSADHGESARK
jgi:hypothetical protein